MSQHLLVGSLSVAGKMHVNKTERHAQRQDPETGDRHLKDALGRILIEKRRERDRAEDDQKGDDTLQQHETGKHIAHDVGQGLPVFLTDTDADQHARNCQHACRDRPEDIEQIVRSGKSRDADTADKGFEQPVDDQTAAGLVNVAGSTGQADTEDLSCLLPVHLRESETEMRLSGNEGFRLYAEEDPHAERRGKRQSESFELHHLYEHEVQQDIDSDIDDTGGKSASSLVFDRKEGGERIAQQQRDHADRLAKQILIQICPDTHIFGQEAGQIEQTHRNKGSDKDDRYEKRKQQRERKDALHLLTFVLSHVFSA